MIIQCKNCLPKEGIEIPHFSPADQQQLATLARQSPVLAVKYIIDHFRLSHRDAKYIAAHISKAHGRCHSCVFDRLDDAYINCPKCGALNLNW
jgi:hypothetical protein